MPVRRDDALLSVGSPSLSSLRASVLLPSSPLSLSGCSPLFVPALPLVFSSSCCSSLLQTLRARPCFFQGITRSRRCGGESPGRWDHNRKLVTGHRGNSTDLVSTLAELVVTFATVQVLFTHKVAAGSPGELPAASTRSPLGVKPLSASPSLFQPRLAQRSRCFFSFPRGVSPLRRLDGFSRPAPCLPPLSAPPRSHRSGC